MKYSYLMLVVVAVLTIAISRNSFTTKVSATPKTTDLSGKALFKTYCSICHMTPDPASLSKSIWRDRVLPEMAGRMGIKYPGRDPLKSLSPEEREVIKKNHVIPEKPYVSNAEWSKIFKYVIENAPDSIPLDKKRLARNSPMKQFIRENVPINNSGRPSLITGLEYDNNTKILWIGDYYNNIYNWRYGKGVTKTIKSLSPVVDFNFYKGATYFTQIGKLSPTELSIGAYSKYNDTSVSTILGLLHRPVHAEIDDLDGDGVPEIVMCNFGNKVGSLSLFKKDKSGKYREQVLLNQPGALKCYIKDMDGDGKKDIVAMFAQGDESVYIFYQRPHFKFEAKRVLRFPPIYGTTDMVLVDYNHDGLTDIVTVHGDNADYSIMLKPYHGIRLNINQGNGVFKEKFFYPIYGVTKVLAEDFDKDGDIDFAASAFFPDFNKLTDESFIYLENIDEKNFKFKSYILKSDTPVKSLTLEKADIDGDGDMDIIAGNFSLHPGSIPKKLDQKLKSAKFGLIIFKNQLYQPKKTGK